MMGLFDFFKRSGENSNRRSLLNVDWADEGVSIHFHAELARATIECFLEATESADPDETFLASYLSQLVVEERCQLEGSGITLNWPLVYELLSSVEHSNIVQSLGLPPKEQLRPILDSKGTLADEEFDVHISGWALDGSEVDIVDLKGAVGRVDGRLCLLPYQAWVTQTLIVKFRKRDASKRTQHENELGWGDIRFHADQAGALYRTPYLETTFVLTPKTLRIPMTKEDTPFGRVTTVAPTFAGAPENWLSSFDSHVSVQPHYDFTPRVGGHIRVVISEPVRKVLEVIKREMPTRQVGGSKAERFIHNPWSFLGEVAHEVIIEDTFGEDRAGAGPVAGVFSIAPRIQGGRIEYAELVVTEHFFGGAARTTQSALPNAAELARFRDALKKALEQERALFPWGEFDLSIDGEATRHLEYAEQLLHLWLNQPASKISFEDIYELEGYSGRIEGIGVATAIYVPIFQKPSADEEGRPGWIPGELTPMVRITLAGHEGQVVVPLSKEWVEC